jgi:hypothetical protein
MVMGYAWAIHTWIYVGTISIKLSMGVVERLAPICNRNTIRMDMDFNFK